MVFLRYLTCLVAAFAVVSYTVHLERNTPVVLKVKTILGLDTTNLQEARLAKDGPGLIETALSVVDSVQNIPKVGGLFSDGLNRKQTQILPDPVRGWQREDRRFDPATLLDFEDSFYPNRTKRSDATNEASSQSSEDVAADTHGLSGALYFRESMRLLITMSDPDRIVSVAVKKAPDSASERTSGVLTWRGKNYAVTRDKRTGFAKAGVPLDADRTIGFMGNVPTAIMQEYLDVVSAALPGGDAPETQDAKETLVAQDAPETQETPEAQDAPETPDLQETPDVPEAPESNDASDVLVAENRLLPAPLTGWTGSAGALSFDDILDFDASFARDGKKRSFAAEERTLIDGAFDQGMRIEGGIYQSGETRLLVTLTELPLGEDGLGGMIMGAGIMESTRSFDRGEPGAMIQKDADIMVISRSDELGYADAGLIIGGAYLFQMRGNASDEELETYALALDWDTVRSRAVKLNPDWPGN